MFGRPPSKQCDLKTRVTVVGEILRGKTDKSIRDGRQSQGGRGPAFLVQKLILYVYIALN